MIAIVQSIYSQSVHAPARDAGLMDNDAERYCKCIHAITRFMCNKLSHQVQMFEYRLQGEL